MRKTIHAIFALSLLITFLLPSVQSAAQSGDNIFITGETVEMGDQTLYQVTINTFSAKRIQGLSFKLRYDPVCLRPNGFQSMVLNLNNTSMPQEDGLVDGIFTSTEPLSANGGMVKVAFAPLMACDTRVALESAQLIELDEDRIAKPVENINVDTSALSISLDAPQAAIIEQPTQAMSVIEGPTIEVQPLTDEEYAKAMAERSSPNSIERLVIIGAGILVLFAGILIALIVALARQKKDRPKLAGTPKKDVNEAIPVGSERYLSIRRGIQAGTRVKLEKFPFALGNSPANDLPLEDPSISAFHAKLFLNNEQVILVDLGNPIGTIVNGHTIHNQRVTLKDGDVIKIGAILLSYTNI